MAVRQRGWKARWLLLGALLVAGGCAAMRRQEARKTEDLLTAAGFAIQGADDPDEVTKLQSMEPLRLVRRVKDGAPVYTYADPYSCVCVYVGNAQQYAEYQRLAFQQRLADEQLEAAEVAENAAMMGSWWWW
jgi:hypothetical protein